MSLKLGNCPFTGGVYMYHDCQRVPPSKLTPSLRKISYSKAPESITLLLNLPLLIHFASPNSLYLGLIHDSSKPLALTFGEDPHLDLTFEELKVPCGTIRNAPHWEVPHGKIETKMNQGQMEPKENNGRRPNGPWYGLYYPYTWPYGHMGIHNQPWASVSCFIFILCIFCILAH